jgi:CDP-glucose 4,6-dehydratase
MQDFWKDKKVFITGHTGFKGAWLWFWLAELGAKLSGYALAAEEPSLYRDLAGDELGQSTIGDIQNFEQLQAAIQAAQPDVLFHLAAQPLVLRAYQEPLYTLSVNVQGTAHVLEALRSLDKPCLVIVITTDKVYENREWVYPYRETDPLGGYDLYSSSKACAELVAQSYRSSFFNPNDYAQHHKALATVRAGNVIGGGDWAANRILPDAVRALQQGQSIPLRNPKAIRPWQHVLEALNGYLILAQALSQQPQALAQAYNFGPLYDEGIVVEQVVRWAIEAWGSGEYHLNPPAKPLHEAQLLRLDCSKAVQELGWRPRWTAQRAVQESIWWYKAVLQEGMSARQACAQQIKALLS